MKDKSYTEKRIKIEESLQICCPELEKRYRKVMKDSEEMDAIISKLKKNNTDWKTLNVNCLPEDILVWKIRGDDRTHFVEYDSPEYGKWVITDCVDTIEVMSSMKSNGKFRYRLKQTKKTDEELAEEYQESDGYVCFGKVTVDSDQIKDVQKKAFLAGRKSAQAEQC